MEGSDVVYVYIHFVAPHQIRLCGKMYCNKQKRNAQSSTKIKPPPSSQSHSFFYFVHLFPIQLASRYKSPRTNMINLTRARPGTAPNRKKEKNENRFINIASTTPDEPLSHTPTRLSNPLIRIQLSIGYRGPRKIWSLLVIGIKFL